MIQYPAELPLPLQEGYGLSTVDPMRATQMVTGRTRYRVRHRYVPTEVRVNFNFSETEAALFEGWYVWAINNGFEWFEMQLQSRSSPRRRERPASYIRLNCPTAGVPNVHQPEGSTMTERKDDTQQSQVPAHSTEEEKAKLKDKNKDGIPPGAE